MLISIKWPKGNQQTYKELTPRYFELKPTYSLFLSCRRREKKRDVEIYACS